MCRSRNESYKQVVRKRVKVSDIDPTNLYRRLVGEADGFLFEREDSMTPCVMGWGVLESVDGIVCSDSDGRLDDPLGRIHRFLQKCLPEDSLVPGAFGYLGFEVAYELDRFGADPVREMESGFPSYYFALYENYLVCLPEHSVVDIYALYESGASNRIRAMERLESAAAVVASAAADEGSVSRDRGRTVEDLGPGTVRVMPGPDEYKESVRKAKEHIRDGDIFQIVLSLSLEYPHAPPSLSCYLAMRYINRSPYMYHLRMGDLAIVGTSPERHLRKTGTKIELNPIAGTRRRGSDPEEDGRMCEELLASAKDKAEHMMLVDLGRNDLGRIACVDSVRVEQFMEVERYSHVMHLVSRVVATQRRELDGLAALAATFPAGTVSGAPKHRALQLIRELEKNERGPYAGIIGLLKPDGDLDSCITIRTVFYERHRAWIRAGAGVVADSDPDLEYEECLNKAGVCVRALELAAACTDHVGGMA